jgi:hypothetical protein
MNVWQRWKQTTIANKALVLSGLIVAIGTAVSTGVLIVQVVITRENNRQTSEQISKLIDAANIQAGAANKIADASDKSAGAADSFSKTAQKQLGEMSKQAEAAKTLAVQTEQNARAARDSADTLLASERGWVKITDTKAWGDVFWPPDGSFQLTVKYRLINVGHSVVSGIHFKGKFIAKLWTTSTALDPIQTEITYCDDARQEHTDPKTVRTLFPGDEFWDDTTLSISRQEMDMADKTWPNPYGNREKSVYPTLIGCINYQLPFSKEVHQTRLIYDINWFRPPKPDPWNLHNLNPFPIGRPVPESEIDIRPHVLGGLFAD